MPKSTHTHTHKCVNKYAIVIWYIFSVKIFFRHNVQKNLALVLFSMYFTSCRTFSTIVHLYRKKLYNTKLIPYKMFSICEGPQTNSPEARPAKCQGYCTCHDYFSVGKVVLTLSGTRHSQWMILPIPSYKLLTSVLQGCDVGLESIQHLYLVGLELRGSLSQVLSALGHHPHQHCH